MSATAPAPPRRSPSARALPRSGWICSRRGCVVHGGTRETVLHRLGRQRHALHDRSAGRRQHFSDRIGGHEIGQPQFFARQFVQLFPRRNVERERQQIAAAAHLEGIFRKPPDIAFHDHQVFGGIARSPRIVGAVAHPDLMHPHMRRLRHIARLAGQQQEDTHRLAIGFADRSAPRSPCVVWVRTLVPTVVIRPRLRKRRPSVMESLTEPPLESSTMVAPRRSRPCAKSSKSFGLSAVTMPTALIQPPQCG